MLMKIISIYRIYGDDDWRMIVYENDDGFTSLEENHQEDNKLS